MTIDSSRTEMPLSGRVVVVAGGAGRLGRQFCSAVAGAGGLAIVADLDAQAASCTASDLAAAHAGRAEAAALDISDRTSVCTLIETLRQRHGRIDAVVNNAYPRSAHYGRPFGEVAYDDFCQHLSLHVGGYFLVAQQFSLFFREQGHGNIINISSIYGVIAPRFEIYAGTDMTTPVEYAVSKAAVIHLTRYLAKYLKGTNIRVNTITPGGILASQPTAFLEKYREKCLGKGMLDGADLAGTLLYLLSDTAAHVNGQNIIVDDGFTL
jgi:NAD(P)-dependent dehydrogenase (short-subunit alcohol dehydrogenase family)